MLAVVVGGIVSLVPLVAGAVTFLDPLRKRKGAAGDGFIRIGSLDALTVGGPPQAFPVIAARQDAWTHYPPDAIGSIYLRRTGEHEVEALNRSCPHAGCYVDYFVDRNQYQCPCHTSAFNVEGQVVGGPSPRPLDTLQVDPERLKQGEIWVKFENFRAGVPQKEAVA